MGWPEIFKNCYFEVSSSLYAIAMNHFSVWLWHVVESGYYTTTDNSQLSKKKLQRKPNLLQTSTKKSSWSVCGGLLLLVWATTAFWISLKPLHLRSMLSRLTRCTKNCNTYSWHQSTEWAQFFSMAMPDPMSHNQHFKNWMNLSMNFCLIFRIHMTSHHRTTTTSSISIPFAGKVFPQPARCRKISWILKYGFLCYRKKHTYFSLANRCWV